MLFRRIATIDEEAPTFDRLDELAWAGPTAEFPDLIGKLGGEHLVERAEKLQARIGQG